MVQEQLALGVFPETKPGQPINARRWEDDQTIFTSVVRVLRRDVRAGAAAGCRCQVCDRLVKSYHRAMNADMARFLILLCREYLTKPPGTFVDIRSIPVRGGDYAKLVHWGLVEQAANDDPVKRSSGLWRPTPRGLRFAQGEAREPSHVTLLDNQAIGFDEETVDIWQALGKHFDFAELWGGK